jgi:hypothetical protein
MYWVISLCGGAIASIFAEAVVLSVNKLEKGDHPPNQTSS